MPLQLLQQVRGLVLSVCPHLDSREIATAVWILINAQAHLARCIVSYFTMFLVNRRASGDLRLPAVSLRHSRWYRVSHPKRVMRICIAIVSRTFQMHSKSAYESARVNCCISPTSLSNVRGVFWEIILELENPPPTTRSSRAEFTLTD